MYMHNWCHSIVSGILYIHRHNYNVQLYMAHSPCFISPCRFPFVSPFAPFYYLEPSCCHRIRPPWSQVACKLTSPVPTLCPTLPPPNSQNPNCPAPYYDDLRNNPASSVRNTNIDTDTVCGHWNSAIFVLSQHSSYCTRCKKIRAC